MLARSLAVLAFLVACHSSSAPTTTAPPAPSTGSATPEQTTGSATTAAALPLGEKCGDNDACATGTTCVSYYGVAGARGPQFKTCEVRCDDDSKCPTGHHCATIADGPGRVCR